MRMRDAQFGGVLAQELGVSDYSLYKWRKQARESGELAFPGNGKVALTAEQQENVRLKRELERVRQERDILKKGYRVLCQGKPVRYAFIKEHRGQWTVGLMA